MKKNNFKHLLHYKFDNFMAKGGTSIFISLLVVFLGLLLLIGILRGFLYFIMPETLASQNASDFLTNFFITFLQLTDPGNMAQDITSATLYKIPAIIAGMAGVVMFSALIAFITNALDQKINSLKKGFSKVIEKDHTVILGWNGQRILEIIRELIIANESEKNPCVLVLSEMDKETMDDYLSIHIPDTQKTRIVTRSGSTSSLVNLDIVSINTCNSVIILAKCQESSSNEEKAISDARVIKTVLAVATASNYKNLNLVVEVFNPARRRIVNEISPGNITIVDSCEVLAKVIVQTSRSTGLSMVYNEIFSFAGCEMYFYHDDWENVGFGDLVNRFENTIPLGVKDESGQLRLNPPSDFRLNPKDKILVLAHDDSLIKFHKKPCWNVKEIEISDKRLETSIERELIFGWTPKGSIVLEQYADYVVKGSRIDIIVHKPDESVIQEINNIKEKLTDVEIKLLDKNPFDREEILSIEPQKYDNIVILNTGGDESDAERADTENITVLLMLREILSNNPTERKTKIITEVFDSENHELIAFTGVNDLIISNRLVSMLMAQVSENKNVKCAFDALLEESGSEIYIKPAYLYFTNFPVELTFAKMIVAAQKRNEICIGLKIKEFEKNIDKNFGVSLIPDCNKQYRLMENDALIVLAEDET